MSPLSETALINACRTLFGDELELSREFLWYLQPGGVKSAYRLRAKEAHPDLHSSAAPHVHQRQTACFQQINQAHDLLMAFFAEREKGNRTAQESQPHPPAGRGQESQKNAIPERPLEFGHYLFSCGVIAYRQLIDALVWQRRQRPTIGELAQRFGWLTPEETARIGRDRGPYARFGERAIRLGLLTPAQARSLLLHQRTLHRRIGRYFIEQGILSEAEIERFAVQLDEHNSRVTFRNASSRRQTP
jgi:hypothetical protein